MRARSSWDGPGSAGSGQRTSPKGARSGSKSPGRRSADPKSPGRRSGSKSPGRRTTDPKSPKTVPTEGVSAVSARTASTYRERDLDTHPAHTPNVVRRARLREAQQQQQLQLQQLAAQKQGTISPDIATSQLSYSKDRENTQRENTQHPSPGTAEGAEGRTEYYAEDPFSILYGDDDEFSQTVSSTGYQGRDSSVHSPLPPPAPTPASYPSRSSHFLASPVLKPTPQSSRQQVYPTPSPPPSQGARVPMSESAVADVMLAAQRRINQRGDLKGISPSKVQGPPRRESLSVLSIPASLESSIADLADIMYALGAAKSSITRELPHRRRADSTPYSPGGSDTYSVHSKEADSPSYNT